VSITVVYQGAAEITGAPVVSSRLPNLIALPAAASSAKEDGPLRLAQIELSALHPNKKLPGAFLFITTLPPTSTHTHLHQHFTRHTLNNFFILNTTVNNRLSSKLPDFSGNEVAWEHPPSTYSIFIQLTLFTFLVGLNRCPLHFLPFSDVSRAIMRLQHSAVPNNKSVIQKRV
jgi:hypothetical protein